jgi:hypothetical protein
MSPSSYLPMATNDILQEYRSKYNDEFKSYKINLIYLECITGSTVYMLNKTNQNNTSLSVHEYFT